jgi:pyruvate carboxylase subunit A
VRVDSSLAGPGVVSANYDPMIAKLIVSGDSRAAAIDRMRRALLEYLVVGIRTNIPYHLAVMSNSEFRAGTYTTHFIDEHPELVNEADTWAERQQPLLRLIRDPAKVAAIAAALAVTG